MCYFKFKEQWILYRRIKPTTTKLLNKVKFYCPNKLASINLKKPIQKNYYWSNGIHKIKNKKEIKKNISNIFFAKIYLKYLVLIGKYLLSKITIKKNWKIESKPETIFLITNSKYKKFDLIEDIIIHLKSDYLIAIEKTEESSIPEHLNREDILFFSSSPNTYHILPILKRLIIKKNELALFNIMLNMWSTVNQRYEMVFYSLPDSVRRIVFVEGENQHSANITSQYARKRGIKCANLMNGIKLATPNNSDTDFDKWIIWDEQMKKLLVEHCEVDPRILEVIGHPLEDKYKFFAKHYSSDNSRGLAGLIDRLKVYKSVISIYSTRDDIPEKQQLLNFVLKKYGHMKDTAILIRPHPSEKMEHILFKQNTYKNVFLLSKEQLNKQSLLEQIALSDIGICLASTIAMESRWMKKPIISFEFSLSSSLYCIDNKYIFFCNSTDSLSKQIDQILRNRKIGLETIPDHISTAKKYADFIESM